MDANGYDERTSGSGCSPSGCVPYNTRDGEPWSNSRWSCKGEILDKSDRDDGCCIWYTFEEPQDIEEVSIAFDRGTERTRCLDVFSNGKKIDTINSSGKTSDFEWFNIYTDETKELRFCLCDPKSNENVWLSITEVRQDTLLLRLVYGCRTYATFHDPVVDTQCEFYGRIISTVKQYRRTCLFT